MAQGTQAVLVQVQTLRGNGGHTAALASVQAAVTAYNAANPKATPHAVVSVTALPNNTKGMQWQLALLATLARKNGAHMVRLSVHNGNVALCGTQAAITATQAAMQPTYNALVTAAANAYTPALGNKVGYQNGWLCGAVAGMQVAYKVQAQLQYAIGYLFAFAAPGNGTAYLAGQAVYATASTPKATAPKATAPKTTTIANAPSAPSANPATPSAATTANVA